MESQWERFDPIHLTVDEANARLQGSGHTVTSLQLIPEGLANTNYRATLESGETALFRLYQRETATSGKLELAVSRRWSDSLPIPRVHWLSPDATVCLSQWAPGRTLAQMIAAKEWRQIALAAPSIGETLARIHQVPFQRAGFLSTDLNVAEPWPSVYDGYFGYIRSLCSFPLVRERATAGSLNAIQVVLDDFDRWGHPYFQDVTLSHGDYKAGNLLVHQGTLSAVLDWEFVHAGHLYLDLGILLRYSHHWPVRVVKGILSGLRAGGVHIPSEWRQITLVVDFLSLLDFLSRPGSGPTAVAAVNQLIERSLHLLRSEHG